MYSSKAFFSSYVRLENIFSFISLAFCSLFWIATGSLIILSLSSCNFFYSSAFSFYCFAFSSRLRWTAMGSLFKKVKRTPEATTPITTPNIDKITTIKHIQIKFTKATLSGPSLAQITHSLIFPLCALPSSSAPSGSLSWHSLPWDIFLKYSEAEARFYEGKEAIRVNQPANSKSLSLWW